MDANLFPMQDYWTLSVKKVTVCFLFIFIFPTIYFTPLVLRNNICVHSWTHNVSTLMVLSQYSQQRKWLWQVIHVYNICSALANELAKIIHKMTINMVMWHYTIDIN